MDDGELAAAGVRAYREYDVERGMLESELYPAVADTLSSLQESGFVLGLATSKPTVHAEQILQHFGLRSSFTEVVGAERDGSRRHKDEVFAEVLGRLVIGEPAVGRAVMVGDRAHDVRGAAAVGIPCVGVAWGYADDGELAAAGAACVVDSATDLLRKLRGWVSAQPLGNPSRRHDAGNSP